MHTYWVGGSGSGGVVNSARFARYGWTLVDRFNYGQARSPGGYTGGSYPAAVEFMHTGSVFELKLYADATSLGYRLFVDGQPVSTTQTSPATSAGGAYLLPVTFSGRATRHIRLEFIRSTGFGGVIIGPTRGLQAARPRPRKQVLLLGDSYADGANGVSALDTYAHQLGRYLDADLWVDAQGGTGIVANGGLGTKAAYLARLTACATETRLRPDIVIIQGSTNDGGGNESSVVANLTTIVAAVRAQWPNALLIVTGVLLPAGTGHGSRTSLINTADAGIITVAASRADLHIPPFTDSWYTGTGKVGSTAGNGNADFFLSSDGVHPSADGHDFIVKMLVQHLSGFLAAR